MADSSRFVGLLLTSAMLVTGVGLAQIAHSGAAWAAQDDENKGGAGPNDNFRLYLDRIVHPTAEDSCTPGFIWQGAGNPATTFQRKRNLDAGIELAIKAIFRQGPDIPSTYVDRHGFVHIEVPSGSQVTPAPNPNRAAWNFTYSYDVALDPSNPSLDQYKGELWIDLDPSEKTKYLKLDLARLTPTPPSDCAEPDESGFGWKSGNTVVIGDDEGDGTARVTQNSQNLAFYRTLIDDDPDQPGIQPYNFGPGEFDVVMMLEGKGPGPRHQHSKTLVHVIFDVVDAPTQTP